MMVSQRSTFDEANADRFPIVPGSTNIKRVNTVAGVTAEAREVLEQFLQRSLSDVNQRGRPGGLQRAPLSSISEHGRVRGGEDQLNGGRHIAHSAPSTSQRVSLNSSVDINKNSDSLKKNGSRGSKLSTSGFETKKSDDVTPRSDSSLKNMLAESETSDLTDVDDITEAVSPKKKKSIFKRARERLQATFSRNRDHEKYPVKSKEKNPPKGPRKRGVFESFRQKSKKTDKVQDQVAEVHVKRSKSDSSHEQKYATQKSEPSDQVKSKTLLSALQKKISLRRAKRSQSKESTSTSLDDVNILPLTDSQQRILGKYTKHDQQTTPKHSRHLSDHTAAIDIQTENGYVQGHHSSRSKLQLEGLDVARPQTLSFDADELSVHAPSSAVGWDYIDGVTNGNDPTSIVRLTRLTSKPFDKKSPSEKDEILERVAAQLAEIGDLYNFNSPSDDSSNRVIAEDNAPQQQTVLPQPSQTSNVVMSTLVSDLLSNATYSSFQRILNGAVGGESGLQQIALVFHVAKTAMQLAGTGSSRATRIKDMTLTYFEQYFAPWIIQKGGWASVVDESTTTDSELD